MEASALSSSFFSPDFRKGTESIQTEAASSAVAEIDWTIQAVVLQQEDQSIQLMRR